MIIIHGGHLPISTFRDGDGSRYCIVAGLNLDSAFDADRCDNFGPYGDASREFHCCVGTRGGPDDSERLEYDGLS